MKTALFVHGAIPGVDKYLCKKSQTYIDDLLLRGEAVMLPASAYHRPAVQLLPPRSARAESGDLNAVSAPEELSTNSAISAAEMVANVGLSHRPYTDPSAGAVYRAQAKVKAWMSKATEDDKNPLPRGKWADMSQLQVVAVP